jgi:hypothetical protein
MIAKDRSFPMVGSTNSFVEFMVHFVETKGIAFVVETQGIASLRGPT